MYFVVYGRVQYSACSNKQEVAMFTHNFGSKRAQNHIARRSRTLQCHSLKVNYKHLQSREKRRYVKVISIRGQILILKTCRFTKTVVPSQNSHEESFKETQARQCVRCYMHGVIEWFHLDTLTRVSPSIVSFF